MRHQMSEYVENYEGFLRDIGRLDLIEEGRVQRKPLLQRLFGQRCCYCGDASKGLMCDECAEFNAAW